MELCAAAFLTFWRVSVSPFSLPLLFISLSLSLFSLFLFLFISHSLSLSLRLSALTHFLMSSPSPLSLLSLSLSLSVCQPSLPSFRPPLSLTYTGDVFNWGALYILSHFLSTAAAERWLKQKRQQFVCHTKHFKYECSVLKRRVSHLGFSPPVIVINKELHKFWVSPGFVHI